MDDIDICMIFYTIYKGAVPLGLQCDCTETVPIPLVSHGPRKQYCNIVDTCGLSYIVCVQQRHKSVLLFQ